MYMCTEMSGLNYIRTDQLAQLQLLLQMLRTEKGADMSSLLNSPSSTLPSCDKKHICVLAK